MLIKPVKTKDDAEQVVVFLLSRFSFDLEMTEFRQQARRDAVLGSLVRENARFWYLEEDDQIVGAIGVTETERENGGYYLDYFAVHQDFRRQGLGSRLLRAAEEFVRSRDGRFILIDTGSTDSFRAARQFYETHGYEQVGMIPDYYAEGDHRFDYYKKLN